MISDLVIQNYGELVCNIFDDVYVFPPYLPRFVKKRPPWKLEKVLRWLFFPRIFVYDKTFQKKHWVLFAVCPQTRLIIFLNSVEKCHPSASELQAIKTFLYLQKKEGFLTIPDGQFKFEVKKVTQQLNSIDCGIFVLEFILRLAR